MEIRREVLPAYMVLESSLFAWDQQDQPAPAVDRIVSRLAREPCTVRMNNDPEVCNVRDRLTGETGRRLGGLGGVGSAMRPLPVKSISRMVALCSDSSPTGDRTRTFFNGDDCRGEAAEENECFLFLLGVRIKSSGKPSAGSRALPAFEVLVNAGPKRFTAGGFSVPKACRFVFTLLPLFPLLSKERGVKKRRKDRGVTVGGFRGLRPPPASDATDGGEDGSSWDEGGRMGSDRGGSGRPETRSIVPTEEEEEERD